LDVTYHELSGYWGGLNEAAAWQALWHGSPARPFHPLRLLALLASGALLLFAAAATVRAAVRRRAPREDDEPARPSLRPFAIAALVAISADVGLLAVTGKQVFAHYVTPTFPFLFVIFAAGARAVFAAGNRALRIAFLALAAIVCVGGVEATLAISHRID